MWYVEKGGLCIKTKPNLASHVNIDFYTISEPNNNENK